MKDTKEVKAILSEIADSLKNLAISSGAVQEALARKGLVASHEYSQAVAIVEPKVLQMIRPLWTAIAALKDEA
jgi:hypothetical protein